MSLRSFNQGQIKSAHIIQGKEMLPIQKLDEDLDCKVAGNLSCFKSGDDRSD